MLDRYENPNPDTHLLRVQEAFLHDDSGAEPDMYAVRSFAGRRRAALAVRERRLSVVAPTFLSATTPPLLPRTDRELARLDEVVFLLHAVTAGLPVAAEDLVPAVGTGWSTGSGRWGSGFIPRGVRVLAIVHGEVAAGMD